MDEREVLDEAELACLTLVRGWRDQVNSTAGQAGPTRVVEALIEELEQLKHAISARQIELTAQVRDDAHAPRHAQNVSASLADRFAGATVALARRRHPITGTRLVHQAHVLTDDMPEVLAAMRAGELGETQAAILVRETDGLSRSQRARITGELRDRWAVIGDRGLSETTRDLVARIAPEALAERHAKAAADRHVSYRCAPDAMLRLSALLPVREGLACIQALQTAADRALTKDQPGEQAESAPRSRRWRQAQADAMVTRITGTAPQELPPVGVRVNLMIPIEALTDDAGGSIEGYGMIGGHLVRELIQQCPDANGPQIRRLFTQGGDLVGMESRARSYPGLLKEFIRLRDQRCRTPFCESSVKQIDHIEPAAAGGATSESNARACCEWCNYVKEHPGYQVTGDARCATARIGMLSVASNPPAPPGKPPPTTSHFERRFIDIIWGDLTSRGFNTPRRQ